MVFLFLSWSVPCSYGSRHHGHTQLQLSECSCWRCSRGWYIPATKVEPNEDTCIQAGKYAGESPSQRHDKDLFFSAVTFLAFFQVAIATALPSVHRSGVWQVEETLPTSRAQVAPQLLQVAVIKHTWKRVTGARWERSTKKRVSDVLLRHFPLVWSAGELYPVAAAIMQPPSSPLAWQQPALSWVIPKLCPISCAMVAATPTADSEWSWWTRETNGIPKSTANIFLGPHLNSRPSEKALYFQHKGSSIFSAYFNHFTVFTPPDW